MSLPLISVIIPVYNSEKYLSTTLRSLQNQTYKNFEAVCIDDGSSDGSWQILQDFAAQDKRFKIYRQENAGGSAARNKGLSLASGEYLAFLDNDDIYHPQYLEILHTNLINANADVSCCSYIRFDGDNDYRFADEEIEPHIDFVSVSPFHDKFVKRKKIDTLMWVKLYKRELFSDTQFALSLPAINDILLNIEILLKSKKVAVCSTKLIAYRIIKTSQTMKPLSPTRIAEYKNLAVEITELGKQYPQEKQLLGILATKYAYGQCIKEYLLQYDPKADCLNYKTLRKSLNELIESEIITPCTLNLRRRLILWAFLHKKFTLLKLIKEK